MITKHYHFETIDSTNKKVKELAAAGAEHGTLVTADAQHAGIGRRGRSWSSEKDAGIYMSLLLRPEIETDKASMLTLVAALAVEKAIEKSLHCQPMIKLYGLVIRQSGNHNKTNCKKHTHIVDNKPRNLRIQFPI